MDRKPPRWRNAADRLKFRSYGGCDAVLRIDGDQLRLIVRGSKMFVAIFGALFIPAFAFTAWYLIPDEAARIFFAFGGSVVGLLTFGFIYWLMDFHEKLGDYLVIDRRAQTVALPRSKVEFPLEQVLCLQRIRGRSKASAEIETDLNLLVAEDQGLVRYHVLGSPSLRLVDEIAQFSGLRVEVIDLGWRGNRDADRDSA